MINYYAVSDIGLYREKNEDSYLICQNKYGDFLFVVCDGIGGEKAGEIASAKACSFLKNEFSNSGPFKSNHDLKNYLSALFEITNRFVYEVSLLDEDYRGMGTTLTGVVLANKGQFCFNIGDSRTYSFNESIKQISEDHTLINQMLKNKEITYEESINHPKKHYLVKALGVIGVMQADLFPLNNEPYFLICSDGLHGFVDDKEIENVLKLSLTVEEKTKKLLDIALKKGGYDNITIILVENL